MSVADEIERIENAKEQINSHIESLGATRGSTINDIAQNITVLTRPTGQAGQLLGFTDDNVVGAVNPHHYGVILQDSYIVGENPFDAGWVSGEQDGDPITPTENSIYIIKSDGDYRNRIITWDGEKYVYVATKQNAYFIDDVIDEEIPLTNVPNSTTKTICSITPDKYAVSISINITGVSTHGGANPVMYVYSGGTRIDTIDLRGTFNIQKTYDDPNYMNKPFRIDIESSSVTGYKVDNVTGTVTQNTYARLFTEDFVPASEINSSKSGLVPSAENIGTAEALTPKGWDEIDFNITREELKQSFESASGIPSNNANTYSTDELVIGTWIDGKPLYRKTFLSNATLIPMQWFHTDTPIGDSEQIVNASAYATNGAVVGAINASNDNPTFHLNYCGQQGVNISIYAFTLEYTKTTD